MTRRPRIRDVAELAGVAPSTVSVVLNDTAGARVAGSTRDRVRAAAAELGYVPNSFARGLRTRRSGTLAFIGDVIATTPYAGELIQGAQEAAWEAGYLLMLVNTGGDAQLEERAVRALRRQQVEGALYATMYHRAVTLPEVLDGLPTVLLDARPVSGTATFVVPDEQAGAEDAVEELVRLGHRRIAFVRDLHDGPAVDRRQRGYESRLAAHGLELDERLVVRERSDSAGGERAAAVLLDAPDPPTAVFTFNDQMAIGVYRAAAARGVRIPQDLSVIGFDDLYVVSSELTPGLTTMALPHREMGRLAARALIAELDGGEPTGEQLVPCPLVRRGSAAPPHP
ncbi:LacI family DNA-binding transcriptional regulator [Georgenia wutianyii]|uniref:LacI family DNA-binding transcriptional regulator n=1 Tax=Georgenia wutianyii TaxID=2585135 RepID=A0ABX5VSU5_9MICO|nr:LacI family DNA-binding transcriptional regulator [Georgenia wutianyii]QDB79855.1 LacI family DNA-binding transcriptional regulator [Georgenia wutianyii]